MQELHVGAFNRNKVGFRAAMLAALLSFLQVDYASSFLFRFGPSQARAQREEREMLTIVTDAGPVKLSVEVARTAREKALGLMFRQDLAARTGMLFPYDEASDLTMWMRNTYISLDMIFIREDGQIARIERNTEPFSEKIIAAGTPVTAVLEIAGGEADRLGIEAGDVVRHPHFGQARTN